jgi:3-hydroxy-9,10-secoandrosta-1,3,5(10)-triene-9,17-dione monooxygenase
MLGIDAPPPRRLVLVPRSEFQVVDTWFVSGLRGTGSNDIVVDDVFVPAHRVMDVSRAGVDDWTAWELHRRPTYRLPLRVMLTWDLVAPLVGIAQGMVDDFLLRFHGSPKAEDPLLQLRLAESSAEVDAARVVFRHTMDTIVDGARRGVTFSELEKASFARDRALVVRLCMQAVNRLFDASGGHALFESEPIQRFHRDAHALTHRAGLAFDTVGPIYGRLALTPDPPR